MPQTQPQSSEQRGTQPPADSQSPAGLRPPVDNRPIVVRPLDPATDKQRFKKDFVLFPWRIYRAKGYRSISWAKAWCPPLIIDQLDRFNREKNVFLKRIDVQPFVAYRGDEPVGRITAQINRAHLEVHNDGVGFFGYFECIEDYEVAKALLDTAAIWLKERGMRSIRGPFNVSINDDWGWKCDCGPGFPANYDTMPMVYQPHNPPYYISFAERYGLVKVQDHYAYHLDPAKGLSEKMLRVAALVEARASKRLGKVEYRSGDTKHWDREVALVKEIHADAWEQNWGTVPYTLEEIDHVGKDLKMVIFDQLIWFVFVNGEVAGFIMALPDVNQVQSKINGRLLPFGIVRLLWGLKVRRSYNRARCILLGVKKKFRGMGLEAPLITKLYGMAEPLGIKDVELSWILESNKAMRAEVEPFSDGVWMSYRAFEKSLGQSAGTRLASVRESQQ